MALAGGAQQAPVHPWVAHADRKTPDIAITTVQTMTMVLIRTADLWRRLNMIILLMGTGRLVNRIIHSVTICFDASGFLRHPRGRPGLYIGPGNPYIAPFNDTLASIYLKKGSVHDVLRFYS